MPGAISKQDAEIINLRRQNDLAISNDSGTNRGRCMTCGRYLNLETAFYDVSDWYYGAYCDKWCAEKDSYEPNV